MGELVYIGTNIPSLRLLCFTQLLDNDLEKIRIDIIYKAVFDDIIQKIIEERNKYTLQISETSYFNYIHPYYNTIYEDPGMFLYSYALNPIPYVPSPYVSSFR